MGRLPGQGGKTIRFAIEPSSLQPDQGEKPIGSCTGYTPAGCGNEGYASSDIYYMEVRVVLVVLGTFGAMQTCSADGLLPGGSGCAGLRIQHDLQQPRRALAPKAR